MDGLPKSAKPHNIYVCKNCKTTPMPEKQPKEMKEDDGII
jgi:predicted metal-binding protein